MILSQSAPAGQDDRIPARRPTADLPLGRTDDAARVVDDYFAKFWSKNGVIATPLTSDAAFLRRASLSVLGVPAEADEVRTFLADTKTDKRRAKINELLVRSRYADYWAFRLREWVIGLREVKGQGADTWTLYRYAREAMAENRSWARIAADMINSQGTLGYDGNANFGVYLSGAPNEMADGTARLFLGAKISCAQCHDDPFHASWTRQSYWGLAAFFGRTKMVQMNAGGPEFDQLFPNPGRSEASVSTLLGGDAAIDGDGGEKRAILDSKEGEVFLGGKKPKDKDDRPLLPLPLGGTAIKDADRAGRTRRQKLVEWVTARDNPYFARAAVNRMFLELTGRGFVATSDGLNPDESPRHQALLDQLARLFAEHDYDLKWLIRTIVNSRVFQLDSGSPGQSDGNEHWNYAALRTLNGDQWHDSVLRASGREARIRALADAAAAEFEREQNERLITRQRRLTRARKVLTDGGQTQRLATLPSPDSVPVPSVAKTQFKAVSDTGLGAKKKQAQTKAQAGPASDRDKTHQLRQQYEEIGKALQRTRAQAHLQLGPTGGALMQMNGKLVLDSLRETGIPLSIVALKTPELRLDAVYLQVLGRLPRDDERRRLAESVAQPSAERVTDLMWTLMQTSDFLTY